jgi:DNA-binding transcriptional ArsR family regulator
MTAFEALADPTRRRILELLAEGERSAGELVQRFEVSQPAVSQHLRKLREAGLVAVRADAQRRVYRINPEGFRETEDWIARTQGAWNRRLAALKRDLKQRAPAPGGNGR